MMVGCDAKLGGVPRRRIYLTEIMKERGELQIQILRMSVVDAPEDSSNAENVDTL